MHWTRNNTATLETIANDGPAQSARLLAVAGLALPLVFAFLVVVFGGDASANGPAKPASATIQAR